MRGNFLLYRGLLLAVLAMAIPPQANSQTLPESPVFGAVGLVGGFNTPKTYPPRAGVLKIEAGFSSAIIDGNWQTRALSFNYLALQPQWGATPALQFEVMCVYRQLGQDLETTTGLIGPNPCPGAAASPQSDFVRAIRITLAGSDAPKYQLEYDCRLGSFGTDTLSNYQKVRAGEWCGDRLGHALFWINQLTVYLKLRK